MKRLLITGASGLVGSHLMQRTAGRCEVLGTYRVFRPQNLPGRLEQIDLTDFAIVERTFEGFRPDAVIHCAAEADADHCQADPVLARRINVDATANLARLARRLGAKFVFLSTDLVFDGRNAAAYVEDDPPCPLSAYAETKVEAERVVRAECEDWVITRNSLVFGPSPRGDRGIEEKIGIAIRQGRTLKLFVDEFRSPISAANLAEALLELAASEHRGVFHLVGADLLSRYDIALAIVRHFGWSAELLQPARVADVPLSMPRPGKLWLSTEKARAVLKTKLMGLGEALQTYAY